MRPAGERNSAMRRASPGRFWHKFTLSFISLLATLAVLEIFLRNTFVPVPRYAAFQRGIFVSDDTIGYRLRPNYVGVSTDGYFYIETRIDANGLRDVYDPRKKDVGIIAIGDSETFGHGLKAEESWPEQLQDKIGINVINTGVPGYSPSQYLHVLKRIHAMGRPVSIVLYAMPWNDITHGDDPPDYNIIVDGWKFTNPKYMNQHYREFSLIEKIRENNFLVWLLARFAVMKTLWAGTRSVLSYLGVQTTKFYDDNLEKHAEGTRRHLLEIRKFLNSIGAKLVIVHIGNADFAIPEIYQEYERRHTHTKDFARTFFEDWSKRNGMVFHDAVPELTAEYLKNNRRRTSIRHYSDGHFNGNGNRVIAEAFRAALYRHGLLPAGIQ